MPRMPAALTNQDRTRGIDREVGFRDGHLAVVRSEVRVRQILTPCAMDDMF